MEIGTTQTWAYVNGQLDYPEYKRVRVHIIRNDTKWPNEARTLCGLPVRSYWETMEADIKDFLSTWPCLSCKGADQCRRGVEISIPPANAGEG